MEKRYSEEWLFWCFKFSATEYHEGTNWRILSKINNNNNNKSGKKKKKLLIKHRTQLGALHLN